MASGGGATPDDPVALQQVPRAAIAEIERRRLIIVALQRNCFGRHSEKLDEATVQQRVEDLEQSLAEGRGLDAALARANAPKTGTTPGPPQTEPAKRNRGALPAVLPRIEQVIDVEDKTCPCCGGALQLIGEDCPRKLEMSPARKIGTDLRPPGHRVGRLLV